MFVLKIEIDNQENSEQVLEENINKKGFIRKKVNKVNLVWVLIGILVVDNKVDNVVLEEIVD